MTATLSFPIMTESAGCVQQRDPRMDVRSLLSSFDQAEQPPISSDASLQSLPCYASSSAPLASSSAHGQEADATLTEDVRSGPSNAPFIWAETRQELCESLPYYRSYQSGSYVKGMATTRPSSMRRSLHQMLMCDSYVNGYLLGGCPSRRDMWAHDGRVIISHGGGKSSVAGDRDGDAASPACSPSKLQLVDDQREDDPVISALIQTMRMRIPTVLIAAENYALLPIKLNCSFAVLGWYLITDGWAEKEADESNVGSKSFVRWKFRFESGPTVVASASTDDVYNDRDPICRRCRRGSPIVFESGWMCLAPKCSQFFKPQPLDALEFCAAFLAPRGDAVTGGFPGGEAPFSLLPTRAPATSLDQAHGLWCSRCGRLSCRSVINRPTCPHCRHRVGPESGLPLVPPPRLTTMQPDVEVAFVAPSSGIAVEVKREKGSIAYSFRFPERFGGCAVHLVQADLERGEREAKADKLFRQFQLGCWPEDGKGGTEPSVQGLTTFRSRRKKTDGSKEQEEVRIPKTDKKGKAKEERLEESHQSAKDGAIADAGRKASGKGAKRGSPRSMLVPFRRHPLRSAALKGGLLTQQFTVNYGMAYKHVVAMGTHPLDAHETPKCITGALKLVRTRTGIVCPLRRVAAPDELGHGQTNDEDTGKQGPKRCTRKYFHASQPPPASTLAPPTGPTDGANTTTPAHPSPPPRSPAQALQPAFNEAYGCLYLPHQSMSFHDDGEPGLGPLVSSLSLGSAATMKFRVKAKYLLDGARLPRDRDGSVRAVREQMQVVTKERTVLALRLRHGSVCVQEGAELQKRFEHAVEPAGFRVACTTRWIEPELNTGKRPP